MNICTSPAARYSAFNTFPHPMIHNNALNLTEIDRYSNRSFTGAQKLRLCDLILRRTGTALLVNGFEYVATNAVDGHLDIFRL
ncbi:MAG: hypothetical protein M3297_14765 [Thermoproteota archaeon]|nr:hypothetical protein [Thermoproteota archaeon]